MSGNQYPGDVQFAGLIQAATAAADAQDRNASILGKRRRSQDDSLIDTQLRAQQNGNTQDAGQLSTPAPTLQSSASVLFREPSEKSKKYSRPPLGKVYLDLQLAPESFLRLQNAAKTFMLDEVHMERRDVVGHKKNSSNNDVAKLRLWSCVEEFFNADNNGERFFGRNAGFGLPNAPVRTIFWPEDGQKIIKQCMPLFRKMVTNERQRIYASETRKQDSNKTDKSKDSGTADSQVMDDSPLLPLAHDASVIDQSLDASSTLDSANSATGQQQHDIDTTDHVKLHVNVIANHNETSHRLVPKFSISSAAVPTLSSLIAEVHKKYDVGQPILPSSEQDWFSPAVKVWLPDGIVRIKSDGHWMVALLSASMVDWMDSELRVLIDLETASDVLSE